MSAGGQTCVAYYRVSIRQQALSGLGIEAQQSRVRAFVAARGWTLLAEFEECESGRTPERRALEKRPQLRAALELCRKKHAVLVIAALDRLARSVAFISGLIEAKVRFVACDMAGAPLLALQIGAIIAEQESRLMGARIRAAVAAKKRRGLSHDAGARRAHREAMARAESLRAIVDEIRSAGYGNTHAICRELNRRGVPTVRGGRWSWSTVRDLLHRLG